MCDQATADRRVAPRDVPPQLRLAMEEDFNPSQMTAVTSGLNGSEVNLIQGPPGQSCPFHGQCSGQLHDQLVGCLT